MTIRSRPTFRTVLVVLISSLGTLFMASSCNARVATQVEREKLFSLSYGRFEDEIDLFRLDTSTTGPDTQIFMRDGMFYISNSGSKKILQLTSFGDLLSVYYNPEDNPVPSYAVGREERDGLAGEATRKATAYPFVHPVFLTVDAAKRLSVVDQIPPERYEYDNDEQVLLRDVVLRFGSDSRFMDYLGQEGPGGTPFPPVSGIFSNSRGETIVTARTQSGVRVFWFDADGNLLYRIPIQYRSLPSPFGGSEIVYSSLEKVVPDPESLKLYLKIDYYAEEIDKDTGAAAGIAYNRSCLYPFDIQTGSYDDKIDLPSFEGVDKDGQGTITFRKPYEFLGITSSGWAFLLSPDKAGYALEILDVRSRRIHKRILSVSQDELAYNALMLSPDGIISALLATPWNASIVWWRTDSLIGEIRR